MVQQLYEVDIVRVLSSQGYEIQHRDDDGNLIGDYYCPHFNGGLTDMNDLEWFSANPKPTEQQLVDWETDRLAEVAIADNIVAEVNNIRSLAGTARGFSPQIRLVFGAIKNAQFTNSNTDATFNAVTTALNDASIGTGFRNAVTAAYQAQGVTVDLGNLGGETQAQKERFNAFADTFFTSWAFMAFIG